MNREEDWGNSHFLISPIGKTFSQSMLEIQCKSVFGGVAFPSERPGFVLVVGMSPDDYPGIRGIAILDEFESPSMRKIVRQCGLLDLKYAPAMWIGDSKNDAARRFIDEMNEDLKSSDGYKEHGRFSLTSTSLLDMEQPYPYFLDTIKELLKHERRKLYLKDSKVISYLAEIEASEIVGLQWGAYPAIEALAFAVIEMRDRGGKGHMSVERWRELKRKYCY